MARLLSRNTCQTFDIPKANQNNHPRNKRQMHAGDFDIKAIQTTVNDHRTMIEYLLNNSINETILANALYDYSRTTPSITSWRHLIAIVCIGLLFTILLYLLACRAGFSIYDKILIRLFRPILLRLQHQIQQQLHQDQQLQQHKPVQKQQPIPQQQETHPYQIHQQQTPIIKTEIEPSATEQGSFHRNSPGRSGDSVQIF